MEKITTITTDTPASEITVASAGRPAEPGLLSAETTMNRGSLVGLLKNLTGDTRAFLREEVQLAKTEFSEKISKFTRNTTALAIGGLAAYAGLIVFLAGLGVLLAWVFAQAGAAPLISGFLGLGIIGLVVIGIGAGLVFKGLKTLKQESLAPERTLQTLQELKGRTVAKGADMEPTTDLSAEELQGRIEARENRMGETLDEIGRRLSPSHLNAQVKQQIRRNPFRAGLVAMVVGLAGGLVLRRKLAN